MKTCPYCHQEIDHVDVAYIRHDTVYMKSTSNEDGVDYDNEVTDYFGDDETDNYIYTCPSCGNDIGDYSELDEDNQSKVVTERSLEKQLGFLKSLI